MNASGKMHYTQKVSEVVRHLASSRLRRPAWLGGQNQGFGNSGKDAVVGPGRVNFTTSLYKSFAITERAHFELRFESFNTFNHTQYNNIERQLNTTATMARSPTLGSAYARTWRQVRFLTDLKTGAAGNPCRALFFVGSVFVASRDVRPSSPSG